MKRLTILSMLGFWLMSLLLAGCGSSGNDVVEVTLQPSTLGGLTNSQPSAAGLPSAAFKQTPQEITFHDCPPEGDGGDPVLNQNKNRIDEGNYQTTSFSAIMNLTWPSETERTRHDEWSASATAAIDQAEGLPVMVEGYLALAREEGPESPNCHSSTDHDFHIWFIDHPGGSGDRAESIVVEMTPRVRANHPNWTVDNLLSVAQQGLKVRVSGWIMFDPEHPEQLGNTRGTLWEIHPVMNLEVQSGGTWVSLDNYQP